jgi:hypothetical protein
MPWCCRAKRKEHSSGGPPAIDGIHLKVEMQQRDGKAVAIKSITELDRREQSCKSAQRGAGTICVPV